VSLKDNKLVVRAGKVDIDLGIAPPKNLLPEPEFFSLIVNTDDLLVLERLSTLGKGPPEPKGRMQLEIVLSRRPHRISYRRCASALIFLDSDIVEKTNLYWY